MHRRKPQLTKQAMDDLDEQFRLEHEGLDILNLIVSEWESDPTSVACFDLRMVERAGHIIKRLKVLTHM
jgi:hypothetical protein